MTALNQLRQSLFKIAVEKGYCNIYSEHDIVEGALQRVVDDWGFKRQKKKEVRK